MTEIETINGWTFEETIQTTENLMEVESNVFKWDVLRHLRDFAENFKDELEQYRAIGTVEDLKTMKENGAFTGVELAQILAMQMELKKYQSIGTIEEFKALKEKNEPKKIKGKRFVEAICPICESELFETYWAFGGIHYCTDCGQAIDWQ